MKKDGGFFCFNKGRKNKKIMKIMKKIILSTIIIVSLLATVGVIFAVKPVGNLSGAIKVPWNLSREVMPVPPYGSRDIPGSDTASKLIVNQPNGAIEVTITGEMNGLNPNTTYTVYLSKTYAPYVSGWNIVGDWVLRLHYGSSIYDHDVVINNQSGGNLTGTGGYPTGGYPYSPPYNEIITGTIDIVSGAVIIHSDYENSYWYEATGTIAPNGTMSGAWHGSGQPIYTWESIQGTATKIYTGGNTGWPGLFTSAVPSFIFTTNDSGSGSWHVNLRNADFPELGTYTLSVWINEASKTMLISDTFKVTVD